MSSGYAYKFVITPPGALLCQICQLVAREPQLSVCCGNNFCKLCLEKRTGKEEGCPTCDDNNIFFTTFPNKLSDREIKKLLILCPNKDKGCSWRDELENIDDHLSSCGFEDVQCPGGCEALVERQNVTIHLQNECLRRQASCEHCHVTGEYGWITGQHRDTCAKLPLACPNECGLTDVIRSELKQHLKKCPLQKVYCRFRTMGCEAMILSGSQGEHDDACMKEHFQLMRNELVKAKEELVDLKLQVEEGRFNKSWEEKQKQKRTFPPEDDPLRESKVQQLQDLNAKLQRKLDVVTTDLHTTQEEFTHWKIMNNSFLNKILSTMDWDTRLALSSTLTAQTELVAPVIIKINEVSRKKDHHTVYKSPIFLTHENGHRVYLHALPGGKGYKVTQFSIHIKLMKDMQHSSEGMQRGTFDRVYIRDDGAYFNTEDAAYQPKGRFTVSLLNQLSDSKHFYTMLKYDSVQEAETMDQGDANECQYIMNDCAYFDHTLRSRRMNGTNLALILEYLYNSLRITSCVNCYNWYTFIARVKRLYMYVCPL